MNAGRDETQVQPAEVRVTPGVIAFMALLLLPAVVALGVYLGAWLVAGEVYAAEKQERAPAAADFTAGDEAVAGWKRTLVGVCPLH